jgi:hypothetical protein
MRLTKNDMARVIIQARDVMKELPPADDRRVRLFARLTVADLTPKYERSHAFLVQKASQDTAKVWKEEANKARDASQAVRTALEVKAAEGRAASADRIQRRTDSSLDMVCDDLRQSEESRTRAASAMTRQADQIILLEGLINAAMDEAERKAIDSLSRYKFSMFGYWAGCWVHAKNQAELAGGTKIPSPFRALVIMARVMLRGSQELQDVSEEELDTIGRLLGDHGLEKVLGAVWRVEQGIDLADEGGDS